MRRILFLLFIITLNACVSHKKISVAYLKTSQTEEETKQLITDIASDKFMGRSLSNEGFELASDYVIDFLKQNKIKPFNEEGYKDTVRVGKNISANIVALIGDRDLSKPTILIGAHLDHLGPSRSKKDSIYNGANDNASGVTAVLQVAKQLNQFKFDKNIIIALFTEEENGLIGSQHLAKQLKTAGLNLSYMVNFEMLGKTLSTGANQVYITGYDKSNFAEKANSILGFEFVKFLPAEKDYDLFRRSDNYAFYNAFGAPSHTISTFDFENYNHYHRTSDEVALLDLANMTDVINTSTYLISQMLLDQVVLENTKK